MQFRLSPRECIAIGLGAVNFLDRLERASPHNGYFSPPMVQTKTRCAQRYMARIRKAGICDFYAVPGRLNVYRAILPEQPAKPATRAGGPSLADALRESGQL